MSMPSSACLTQRGNEFSGVFWHRFGLVPVAVEIASWLFCVPQHLWKRQRPESSGTNPRDDRGRDAGEGGWESNPPAPGQPTPSDFEDRAGHRARSALITGRHARCVPCRILEHTVASRRSPSRPWRSCSCHPACLDEIPCLVRQTRMVALAARVRTGAGVIRAAVRLSPVMAEPNVAAPYTPPAAVPGCCRWALPLRVCCRKRAPRTVGHERASPRRLAPLTVDGMDASPCLFAARWWCYCREVPWPRRR